MDWENQTQLEGKKVIVLESQPSFCRATSDMSRQMLRENCKSNVKKTKKGKQGEEAYWSCTNGGGQWARRRTQDI